MSIRSIPLVPLADGRSIPQLGVGTAGLDGADLSNLLVAAVERGWRHIDTARKYLNEEAVGEGLRRAGIPRDELFVTTKLDGEHPGEDAVEGLRGSLARLGLERVDLLLIHWPLPARDRYVETWRVFERLRDEGLATSIGVSNFLPDHLARLAAETDAVPVLDQVQYHPYVQRRAEQEDHRARGIVTEAWSPLGGGGAEVLRDPAVEGIARRHDATPGQVVLAWHLAQGRVAIPRTSSVPRLGENLGALDLELSAEELAAIDALDRPGTGVDPEHDGH